MTLQQLCTHLVGIGKGQPGLKAEAAGHSHGKGPVAVTFVHMIPAGHGRLFGQQISAHGVHLHGGGGGGAHTKTDVGVTDVLAVAGSGIVNIDLGFLIHQTVSLGQTGGNTQQAQCGGGSAFFAVQHALQLNGFTYVLLVHGQRVGLHRGHAAVGLLEAGTLDKGTPDAPAQPVRPLALLILCAGENFGVGTGRNIGVPAAHCRRKVVQRDDGRNKFALHAAINQNQSAATDGSISLQIGSSTCGKVVAAGEKYGVVHSFNLH